MNNDRTVRKRQATVIRICLNFIKPLLKSVNFATCRKLIYSNNNQTCQHERNCSDSVHLTFNTSDKGRGNNKVSRMAKDFVSAFEARWSKHIGICAFHRNKDGGAKDQQNGVIYFLGYPFRSSWVYFLDSGSWSLRSLAGMTWCGFSLVRIITKF